MVERIKSSEVDLPKRKELRFIFSQERQSELLALLGEKFQPIVFSDRNINRTIYFNNQNREVPWDHSLKARQYFHHRSLANTAHLDMNDIYFVELKGSIGRFEKSKRRFEMTLGQASNFLTTNIHLPLSTPLRPFVADEYERFHFQPKGDGPQGSRITCDIKPSYFLIDEDREIHPLGEEPSVRIEVKTAPNQDTSELNAFLLQLEDLGARRSISKKVAVYSLESGYYKSADGLPKDELTDVEIESKLIVVDKDPSAFFNRLVAQMRDGIGDFVIQETFPYVVESGSFNTYYQPEGRLDSEGVKFLSRPTVAKAVLKSESEIIPDQHNLGCILRRKEVKGEYFSLVQNKFDEILKTEEARLNTSLHLVGEIERLRKAFWVINQQSRRVYHVSIDRCRFSRGSDLYELEVEYTGTKGRASLNPEPEIIKDIADLTKAIIKTNPSSVRAEPLTKLEWLRSH